MQLGIWTSHSGEMETNTIGYLEHHMGLADMT